MANTATTVQLILRIPPELREVLHATVEGMNKSRRIGEPEHSINSFVQGCIAEVLQPDIANDNGRARRPRKAVRK